MGHAPSDHDITLYRLSQSDLRPLTRAWNHAVLVHRSGAVRVTRGVGYGDALYVTFRVFGGRFDVAVLATTIFVRCLYASFSSTILAHPWQQFKSLLGRFFDRRKPT